MPELPEVESYRLVAERALESTVKKVDADDDWYLKRSTTADALHDVLEGARFTAARRIGKLLLLDIDNQHVLGLRFGMSGRLLLDESDVHEMAYSGKPQAKWNRFAVHFDDQRVMAVNDARRLGGVELDPDETVLGPDALSLTPVQLRHALGRSNAPLKARLMDQAHIAGVGNLIADEVLFRSGLDPARPAGNLDDSELRRLHRHLRRTVDVLIERGGSHRGDLMEHRVRGGFCPKDGAELLRRTVGGRTTYSCPSHQH